MSKVYFVGAGPGDPELITVKGLRLLKEADMIVYAGSLINPVLLKDIKAKEIYNSAEMTLEEIIEKLYVAVKKGKKVVRLHSGDPAYYSAIAEQICRLKKLGIEYEVIPGVTSASAAAAVIGQELTIPEVSQTVIFTRFKGKTPVPDTENLSELAKHRSTMVIFLSIAMVEKVMNALLVEYPEDTPVVVVEKATWKEEKILRGKLKNLSNIVKKAKIKRTALIIVGNVLDIEDCLKKRSKLYGL